MAQDRGVALNKMYLTKKHLGYFTVASVVSVLVYTPDTHAIYMSPKPISHTAQAAVSSEATKTTIVLAENAASPVSAAPALQTKMTEPKTPAPEMMEPKTSTAASIFKEIVKGFPLPGLTDIRLNRFTTTVESRSQSEPISVRAWANDWQGDFQPGEQAHTFNRVQIMAEYDGGLRVGWLSRYDYVARFSEATAALYYQNKNGLLDETPVSDIYLYAQHLRASGVTFGFNFALKSNLALTLDVTRLRAHDLIQGDIAGEMRINADGDFLVDASVDYGYQQDELFDRPGTGRTLGWGWAVDASLDWRFATRWRAKLDFVDLWNRVEWQRTPFTRATINTVDKLSDQGSVSFEPAISGVEGFRNQRQRLPTRARGYVTRDFVKGMSTHLGLEYAPIESSIVWGMDFPAYIAWPGTNRTLLAYEWGFSVIVPANAVELRQRVGPVYWSIGSDSLNLSEAHWLSVQLGFTLSF